MMTASSEVDEGDPCPIEGCDGKLYYPKGENCSCHINPPCGSCTDTVLTCNKCWWADDGQPDKSVPSAVPQEWKKFYRDNSPPWNTDLSDGKRLIEWNYDSRSGSTMVYTGKYEGPVTGKDILTNFGDGTFGHRGPTLYGDDKSGRFTYTKITD
jgi:hypothetical protein